VGHERWHVDIPHHDPALGLSSRQYRRDAALGGLDLNCDAEQTTAAPFPALPRLSFRVTTVWSIHFRFDSVRLCWRTVTKPAHIATRPDQREKQSVRVLIVEDERIVAMNLEKCLRNLRYEIAGVAVSGEAAIELAGLTLPDLILMDIHLEGPIRGTEAARPHLGEISDSDRIRDGIC
jgi:hypothetical protein